MQYCVIEIVLSFSEILSEYDDLESLLFLLTLIKTRFWDKVTSKPQRSLFQANPSNVPF